MWTRLSLVNHSKIGLLFSTRMCFPKRKRVMVIVGGCVEESGGVADGRVMSSTQVHGKQTTHLPDYTYT